MKLTKTLIAIFFLLTGITFANAQMYIGQDTLYGNEWIDHSKPYFRIDISEDGMYRIDGSTLIDQAPELIAQAGNLQLWHNGYEIPLYVSNEGILNSNDFILFYGKRNRCFLDSLLFQDPKDMLNPYYSLYTDTSAYYLSKSSLPVLRAEFMQLPAAEVGDTLLSYFQRSAIHDYHGTFVKKYIRSGSNKIFQSEYNAIEGFSDEPTNSVEYQYPLTAYASNEDLDLKVQLRISSFYNTTPGGATFSVYINGEFKQDFRLTSFMLRNLEYIIPAGSMVDSTITIKIEESAGNSNDLFMVSNVMITYPAKTQLSPEFNRIKRQHAIEDAYEFDNVKIGSTYTYYDLLEHKIAFIEAQSPSISFKTQKTIDDFQLEDLQDIKRVEKLSAILFRDYSEIEEGSFLFVTSERLHEDIPTNVISEYAAYRSSAAGGSYTTDIIHVEDLYEQYAYGIHRHPLSIKNFLQHLIAGSQKPSFIMLIGKGRSYGTSRTADELSSSSNASLYVPAFGHPASDPPLFAKTGGVAPEVASGRLAIDDLDQVRTYFEKVKKFEAIDVNDGGLPMDQLWRQQFLHLEAGNEAQPAILAAFENMKQAINRTNYKPLFHDFSNSTTTTLDSFRSNEIYELINEGVSVVTYYGHSSSTVLNYSFDNAFNYNNTPRFPLMLALGCSAGNYNAANMRIAQTYCLMEDKGFLNFISTSGLGYVFPLGNIGGTFYEIYGSEAGLLTIGEIYRKTLSLEEASERRHVTQLNFFGDPAIKHYYPREKDLLIDISSVKTEPTILDVSTEYFDFKFNLLSLGSIENSPYIIEVRQEYPDGNIKLLSRDTVASNQFSTPYSYKIELEGKINHGINKIYVTIDADDDIEEKLTLHSESNNELEYENGTLGFAFFVPGDKSIPIWPRNEAIVGDKQLKVYTFNDQLFLQKRNYLLEIDTSLAFNSPELIKRLQESHGNLVSFDIEVPESNEGQVYYWRSKQEGTNRWSDPQSFIYLDGKEGWNISHYHQYIDLILSQISLNDNRQWSYKQAVWDAQFINSLFDAFRSGLTTNNGDDPWPDSQAWRAIPNGLSILGLNNRFDRIANPVGGSYGSLNHSNSYATVYMAYQNDTTSRDSLIHVIENVLPDDYLVIFHTVRKNTNNIIDASGWQADSLRTNGQNIYSILEKYGAEEIRSFENNQPAHYLFAFTKKDGKVYEGITYNDADELSFDFLMTWYLNEGYYEADIPILHPGQAERMEWYIDSTSTNIADDLNIKLYPSLSGSNHQLHIDNQYMGYSEHASIVDLSQSFRIRVEQNEPFKTAYPQVEVPEFLRVFGTNIGDFSFDAGELIGTLDTDLQEGEDMEVNLFIHNINHLSEEVLLRLQLIDRNTNKYLSSLDTLIRVPSGTKSLYRFKSATIDRTGNLALICQLDPERTLPEATFLNNYLEISYNITKDLTAPQLDVSFNGVHIENYDVVSDKSIVKIVLEDENPFLLLDNHQNLNVQIVNPDGSAYPTDPDGNNINVVFTQTGNRGSRMEYILNADFDQSGIYEMLVEGKDATGNEFELPYRVYFQVMHERQANFRVFPNPLIEGKIGIEYVILGGEEQTQMQFEMFSQDGKRIILSDYPEYLLNQGHHTTYLNLSGRLAPGNYFYRITVKDNMGSDFEIFKNDDLGFSENGLTGSIVVLPQK